MSSENKRGNEILIAIIGLIGVLFTAGFSNWDKIFPDNDVIEAKFSGYKPTDNFETELRQYFNVSGIRQDLENNQKQLAYNFKLQLSSEYPEESEEIQEILDIALEEAITLDDMLKNLMPVYKNHYTLEELQELNKFYSTEIMQNMVKKMPLLAQESAPIKAKMYLEFQERYTKRLEERFE